MKQHRRFLSLSQKFPDTSLLPADGGERRALGEPVDEPPLTPRPRKSLFSSESLLQGTRSPFIPAALPAKSVGIFPPTRTRLAGGPPIMSSHQLSPEGEGGTEDKTSGVGTLHSRVGAELCWGRTPAGREWRCRRSPFKLKQTKQRRKNFPSMGMGPKNFRVQPDGPPSPRIAVPLPRQIPVGRVGARGA